MLDDTPVKVKSMLIRGHALPFCITISWSLYPLVILRARLTFGDD